MTQVQPASANTFTLDVANTRSVGVPFVLEPWGEVYELPAQATFRLLAQVAAGTASSVPLEVSLGERAITVWASPGSTVRLFHAERELGAERGERTPVPGTCN